MQEPNVGRLEQDSPSTALEPAQDSKPLALSLEQSKQRVKSLGISRNMYASVTLFFGINTLMCLGSTTFMFKGAALSGDFVSTMLAFVFLFGVVAWPTYYFGRSIQTASLELTTAKKELEVLVERHEAVAGDLSLSQDDALHGALYSTSPEGAVTEHAPAPLPSQDA